MSRKYDKLDQDLKRPKPRPSSSSVAVREDDDKKVAKRKFVDHDVESIEYLRKKHAFIKSTIRTDYQPDICKDYKETGFCGFGDSCKFLHDRTDYKHGWQLDQEYAKGEYVDEADDKYLIKDDEDDGVEDDGIPRVCPVCHESYRDPIVTKCRHYFCSECAESECSDKCFTCEQPTSGIFKNASKAIEDLIKKTTTADVVEESDSNSEPEDGGKAESGQDKQERRDVASNAKSKFCGRTVKFSDSEDDED